MLIKLNHTQGKSYSSQNWSNIYIYIITHVISLFYSRHSCPPKGDKHPWTVLNIQPAVETHLYADSDLLVAYDWSARVWYRGASYQNGSYSFLLSFCDDIHTHTHTCTYTRNDKVYKCNTSLLSTDQKTDVILHRYINPLSPQCAAVVTEHIAETRMTSLRFSQTHMYRFWTKLQGDSMGATEACWIQQQATSHPLTAQWVLSMY